METRESHLFYYHDPACMHESNLTFSNGGKQVAWYCVRKPGRDRLAGWRPRWPIWATRDYGTGATVWTRLECGRYESDLPANGARPE